jgi:hypothetical protein
MSAANYCNRYVAKAHYSYGCCLANDQRVHIEGMGAASHCEITVLVRDKSGVEACSGRDGSPSAISRDCCTRDRRPHRGKTRSLPSPSHGGELRLEIPALRSDGGGNDQQTLRRCGEQIVPLARTHSNANRLANFVSGHSHVAIGKL